MIATTPTQEQVDQIARELALDVVRIRLRLRDDLSDDASRPERLLTMTRVVRTRLENSPGLWESDRLLYIRFRSLSEQAKAASKRHTFLFVHEMRSLTVRP